MQLAFQVQGLNFSPEPTFLKACGGGQPSLIQQDAGRGGKTPLKLPSSLYVSMCIYTYTHELAHTNLKKSQLWLLKALSRQTETTTKKRKKEKAFSFCSRQNVVLTVYLK